MNESNFLVDSDLHARLDAAAEAGGGTATWSILKALNKTNANSGKEVKRSNKEHSIALEDGKKYIVIDSDDDNPSVGAPAAKRTRISGANKSKLNKEQPAPRKQAAPKKPMPTPKQAARAAQQGQSSASRPASPSPAPNGEEQSRQIERILNCPANAYFDILSLANGTDMGSLVEGSWLSLSFMLHPRRCPHPDAVKALSRVNDAYAWIQRHPGLAQPDAAPLPLPHLGQAMSMAPKASVTTTPARKEAEQARQQSGEGPSQQPTQQPQPPTASEQPQDGHVRTLVPRPRKTYPARRSSHIYTSNGRPTIRPTQGWQFREIRGEVRVWHRGNWKRLIQNRPDFQGVDVDAEGWIVPILRGVLSEERKEKISGQAQFEFNTHPPRAQLPITRFK